MRAKSLIEIRLERSKDWVELCPKRKDFVYLCVCVCDERFECELVEIREREVNSIFLSNVMT
jgi:hypothetical protein